MIKYELTIAHRVCPALAKSAVGYADKLDMVRASLLSMSEALKGIKHHILFIVDGCPDSYVSVIRGIFPEGEILSVDSIGNQATYGMQVDLLSRVNDSEFVYFSEDDYIYEPRAFVAMMEWLRSTGDSFATALDHPDRYAADRKVFPVEVRVSEHCHWREAWSTCLTFMTRPEVLRREINVMRFFSRFRDEATQWEMLTKFHRFNLRLIAFCVWRMVMRRPLGNEMYALTGWKHNPMKMLFGHRYRLWSPLPTLAVHLCSGSLPPHSESIVARLPFEELVKYREALRTYLDKRR